MKLKDKILTILRRTADFISGESLAERFSVSRQAVAKAISSIEADGYAVERVHGKGYKLASPEEVVDLAAIEEAFPSLEVFLFDELPSTNSEAGKLFFEGKRSPVLVVARSQTEGRARHGESFSSPAKKGVYFSLLYFPELTVSELEDFLQATYEKIALSIGVQNRAQRFYSDENVVGGCLVEHFSDPDRILAVTTGTGLYLSEFSCGATELILRTVGAILN